MWTVTKIKDRDHKDKAAQVNQRVLVPKLLRVNNSGVERVGACDEGKPKTRERNAFG